MGEVGCLKIERMCRAVDMLKDFFKNSKVSTFVSALFVFFVAFIGSLINLHYGHDYINDDFSQYIMQAAALIDGSSSIESFIKANDYIISHSWVGLGFTVYPWGFPLILAAVMKFGGGFMQLKMIEVVSFCGCAVIVYLLALKRGNRWTALVAALFVAFNYEFTVKAVNRILSDLPYCLFTLLSIYFMESMGEAETKRKEYIYAVLLGLSVAYACEIRSNGYMLVATFFCAVCVASLVNRYKFECLKKIRWNVHLGPSLIFFVVCAVGIFTFRATLPGNLGSLYMFEKFRVFNIAPMGEINFWSMKDILFHSTDKVVLYILYAAFIALFLYGCIYSFQKNFIVLFYSISTFGLYMIWQYIDLDGVRLLYSVILLSVPVASGGFEIIREHKGYRVAVFATCVLLAFSALDIFASGYKNIYTDHRNFGVGAFTKDSLEVYEYIRTNTKQEDIIFFEKPRLIYLYTGRLGFMPQNFFNELDKIAKVDYVLTSREFKPDVQFAQLFKEGVINKLLNEKYNVILEKRYENATYVLWKVVPCGRSKAAGS